MKKKLIAIAIAAAVAAPLTAQAVDMSGDARVRYYQNDDTTMTTKGAQTDSRIGLNITMEDGKTAMAKVRLEINNAAHGAAVNTDTADNIDINVDHAYIKANVGAGVTVTGGKTISNWGHKLIVWDSGADRLAIGKKMGDMAFGLTFTKKSEAGLSASSDDTNDNSQTTLSFKMGKMGGIRYDMMKDETGVGSVDDTRLGIYGGAPLGGGWGLAFEYASTSGDSAGSNNDVGMLIAAAGKVGGANVGVGYATAADGFASDDDFFSFVATGTQAGRIAAMEKLTSSEGNKTTAIFATAGLKMDTVGLDLGLATVGSDVSGSKSTTIVSVKANYPLSKNTKVIGQYGNFSGGYEASQMGASIESKF